MGLVSVDKLQVEAAQDVAEVLPLSQNDDFGFSDLMIRQAAIRNGRHYLQTFDRGSAKVADVILRDQSLNTHPTASNVAFSLDKSYFQAQIVNRSCASGIYIIFNI